MDGKAPERGWAEVNPLAACRGAARYRAVCIVDYGKLPVI